MTFTAFAHFALNVLGGLALFLYGLRILSITLQKISSDKLKTVFDKLTGNRFAGILSGGLVTMVLQSSSATTVLMIGFANAGLLGLAQCISIIYGANIGTTITAQLIAFKYTAIALPLIGIGGALLIFGRSKRMKSIGEVFIGLGMLFYGLKILGSFLKPLKEIPAFETFLVQFGQTPILGLFVGMLLTIIFQSSSATTGMIIIMASLGLLNFSSAFALELGCNIGTTVTAQIASIGANTTSKRAAWAHTLFNVFGALYMLILLHITWKGHPIFLQFIDYITPGDVWSGEHIERHIANAHTFFNIFNVIILFPFINILAKLTMKIIPEKKESKLKTTSHLDPRMMATPTIALQQTLNETIRMGTIAKEMSRLSYQDTIKNKEKLQREILEFEDILNTLQTKIIKYVVKIDNSSLNDTELNLSRELVHLVRHFERIGDNYKAIIPLMESVRDGKHSFDNESLTTLKTMYQNIQNMFQVVISGLSNAEQGSETSMSIKKATDDNYQLENDYRQDQIEKITSKAIPQAEGLYVMEIMAHLEQITKYLSKIAKQTDRINA
ncbi:Na/Pi cotransporter family protein [bacterium]|jgi:phosphate:Na+ symporter|nr:Na/Pi cotransporter family protein [bacterium]